ncbi:putative signal peptide protein [Puccinia sorghi]|uniref:Putative signal peptide protein n=1 Tax=Puccinia sorghi TaxID=27349 RepID=A0A0L6USZ6_9BASI|nr:putative signal peptide protein [Puccinia sorghi]
MFWQSHCSVCAVTVHQSLVEALWEKGGSYTKSFIGLSACQLQAAYGSEDLSVIIKMTNRYFNNNYQFFGTGLVVSLLLNEYHFPHLKAFSAGCSHLGDEENACDDSDEDFFLYYQTFFI